MGIHKVCGGKNEMWALIPQNAPGRGGSVRLEASHRKGFGGVTPEKNFKIYMQNGDIW